MILAFILAFVLASVAAPWIERVAGRHTGRLLALVPGAMLVWLLCQPTQSTPGATVLESTPWFDTLGISLDFFLDGLGRMMAILVCLIGALIFIYQRSYLEHGTQNGKFQAYLMLFTGSMVGITVADNLILMFVFWEMTSITSYLLIGYYHEEYDSRRKALQALLVTGLGGGAMLAGLIFIAADTGLWRFSELLANLDLVTASPVRASAFFLIALGALTKSAQFPFHFWLPNAMAAPTPVSAFLHSATMVKAGVFLLARVHPLFHDLQLWQGLLVSTGLVTMLLAGYAGLREADLKRVLAFTTLAVLGVITAFLGVGGKLAVKAALIFLVAHAFYKAALFMVAGNVDHGTGTRDLRRLGGLSKAMPWTALAAALAAFSKAGLPFLFGFIAKEAVYEAALHSPLAGLAAPLAVAGNALMVALALIAGWHPFFTSSTGARLPHHPHEAPWDMRLGPVLLASLGFAFGCFPGTLGGWLLEPAVAASYGKEVHLHLAIWHGLNLPLLLSVVTVIAGLWLYHKRHELWSLFKVGGEKPSGAEAVYDACLKGFMATADVQTRFLQSGILRRYFLIVFSALISLLAYEFLMLDLIPGSIDFSGVGIYEGFLAVLMALSTGIVMFSSSRFVGLIALGVIGLAVAVLYVLHGAPDLALTQIVVETLTVVLFMLIIARLPRFQQYSKTTVMARDIVFSIACGILVTLLVLKAQDVSLAESISDGFAKMSYTEGHGRNVVNVILVDFRGLDTMGEITVLAIAAVGIFSLMRGRRNDPSDFSQ